MENAEIKFPTIHRNGTSKITLMNQILVAIERLDDAINALYVTSPNARDYYIQGEDAIRLAVEQHVSRLGRIESVLSEMCEIAEKVDAQTI